jgi:hypothetical protein
MIEQNNRLLRTKTTIVTEQDIDLEIKKNALISENLEKEVLDLLS